MLHVLSFYLPWIILAFAIGVFTGLLTWSHGAKRAWYGGWLGWGAAIFAVGLVVALLKLLPGRQGLYLELALLLFASFVIGCWFGAILRALFSPVRETTAAKSAANSTSVAAPVATGAANVAGAGAMAFASAGAQAGKPDDLKRIKGVGKKLEKRLHALGVTHYGQIAGWTPENVAAVDDHLSLQGRVAREDWIGQAKLLASGEETEFSKRVDKGEVATSSDNGA